MDLNKIFSDSRWEMIKELSKGEKSPIELSKKIRTSLANVSMQLKLLEALSIVEKKRTNSRGVGKPRTLYRLKKEAAYMTIVAENNCAKKLVKMGAMEKIIFSAYLLNDQKLSQNLLRFFFLNEDEVNSSFGFSYLGTRDGTIRLLLLHEEKELLIRKIGNVEISNKDEIKKVIVYIYKKDEFHKQVLAGNKEFTMMVDQGYILYDPENILNDLRYGKELHKIGS
ncbi:MAG: winged helix-turn-helix domain-containing protein [Nanoarchaeota archaeon]|nr:winged helix-turn-helix domain-containing protein [Nanoarchaeota archaeon]